MAAERRMPSLQLVMGTREGAIKSAATRVGLSVEEYERRRDNGEKHCSWCREWHPLSEFGGINSRTPICRMGACAAQKALRERRNAGESPRLKPAPTWDDLAHRQARGIRSHGITPEQYESMAEDGCWICGKAGGLERHKRLVVDHDHRCCPGPKSCGRCVRGLLCAGCNKGLGALGDTLDGIQRALDYVAAFEVHNPPHHLWHLASFAKWKEYDAC